ncbi:MAG: RseA family anti-sigma factor [Casimicrobiaceae bacterium]
MGTPQVKATSLFADDGEEMRLREDISRWMDGDLGADEADRVIRLLETEQGRAIWAEMHWVGDCVRGFDLGEPSRQAALTARICTAIAEEPAILAPAPRRERLARERMITALFERFDRLGRGGRAWAAVASLAAVGLVSTAAWQGLRGDAAHPSGFAAGVAGGPGSAGQFTPVNAPAGAPTSAQAIAGSAIDWNALMRAHQESADSTSIYPVRRYLRPVSNHSAE